MYVCARRHKAEVSARRQLPIEVGGTCACHRDSVRHGGFDSIGPSFLLATHALFSKIHDLQAGVGTAEGVEGEICEQTGAGAAPVFEVLLGGREVVAQGLRVIRYRHPRPLQVLMRTDGDGDCRHRG